jgi:hypothetical protein
MYLYVNLFLLINIGIAGLFIQESKDTFYIQIKYTIIIVNKDNVQDWNRGCLIKKRLIMF